MKRITISFPILNRTVPDKPEWSGSGKKITQRHLCHFRGTFMFLLFNQVKSKLADLYLMYLGTIARNLGTNFTEAQTYNLCLVKLLLYHFTILTLAHTHKM